MYPVIEKLVGPVDGSNKVFYTTTEYVPGSVRLWRNGLLGRQDLPDGWDEGGGKKVEFREAPTAANGADVLQAYYLRL